MLPVKEIQSEFMLDEKTLPYTVVEDLSYHNFLYQRIKKNYNGFNYGEVIIDFNRIIPQYPSIYRCYNLKRALNNNFKPKEQFIVEEKLDGYNIRIANISYKNKEGKIVAFTRGGFICPYTTELLENYTEIKKFLLENDDKVLCAEVIGENPYNTLSIRMYGKKPEIFIFDIMNFKNFSCKSRKKIFLLTVSERQALFTKYNLKTAPEYGIFTTRDYYDLKAIIVKFNQDKKEGVVIKPLDRTKKYIKFATPYADIEAITDHISKSFECDTAHFRKRLFLLASYGVEFSYSEEEIFILLSTKLGESLSNVLKANKKIETYELTISEKNWYELEKLLSRTLRITVISKEKIEDNKLRIIFEKYYKKTSEFIKGANAGRLFID